MKSVAICAIVLFGLFGGLGSARAQCSPTKAVIKPVEGFGTTIAPGSSQHVFITQLQLVSPVNAPEINTTVQIGPVLSGSQPVTLDYSFAAPAGTEALHTYLYSDNLESRLGQPITVAVQGSQANQVTINAIGCVR